MKAKGITTFLLATTVFANATVDCVWTSQKAGIAVKYVAPCDLINQSRVDSFLHIVIGHLNRTDTSLKILVLINQHRLNFPGSNNASFFSIGYDTLREIDDDFIFNYYWNETSISTSKNGGLNTFRSKDVPLDINATDADNATKTVGIKIIYNVDYSVDEPVWADLTKAIIYAARNADTVKEQQRRDTVRYFTNGWFVSLLTIDTFAINKIISSPNENEMLANVRAKTVTNYGFMIAGLLGLTLIGVILHVLRKRSRY